MFMPSEEHKPDNIQSPYSPFLFFYISSIKRNILADFKCFYVSSSYQLNEKLMLVSNHFLYSLFCIRTSKFCLRLAVLNFF